MSFYYANHFPEYSNQQVFDNDIGMVNQYNQNLSYSNPISSRINEELPINIYNDNDNGVVNKHTINVSPHVDAFTNKDLTEYDATKLNAYQKT